MPDILEQSIQEVLPEQHMPISRLTKKERLLIIKRLDRQGVFLLKGAISEVATRLKCSEASVYRYISDIAKEE